MAGNCVNSAREVGTALAALHGPDAVRYVAIVYADDSGAARNHIAASLVVRGEQIVVDATWKQFPYLENRITKVTSDPWLRTFSLEAWREMIANYTRGMRDVVVNTEATTIDEARQWMKERLSEVPALVPAVGKPASRGCTLF